MNKPGSATDDKCSHPTSNKTSNEIESDAALEPLSVDDMKDDIAAKTSPMAALDDVLDSLGTGWFQYRLLLITSAGQMFDAAETAVLALTYPHLQAEWGATTPELAVVGSMTGIGMILGSSIFGYVSDHAGRRTAYAITMLICGSFAFASSFAWNVESFAVMRFFLGIGYGGNVLACTTLMVEFVPAADRALFVSLLGVAYGLGAMAVSTVSMWLMDIVGWRWIIRLISVMGIPVLLTLSMIPESVRFLVRFEKVEATADALNIIAKDNNAKSVVPAWCGGWEFSRVFGKDTWYTKPMGRSEQRLRRNVLERAILAAGEHDASKDHHHDISVSFKAFEWISNCRSTLRKSIQGFLDSASKLLHYQILKTLFPLTLVWFFNSFASQIFVWIPLEAKRNFPDDTGIEYSISLAISAASFFGNMYGVRLALNYSRLGLLRFSTFGSAMSIILLGLAYESKWLVFVMTFVLQLWYAIVSNILYLYSPEVFPTSIRVSAFGICLVGHRLSPAIAPFAIAQMLDFGGFRVACLGLGAMHLCASLASYFLTVKTFNAPMVESS